MKILIIFFLISIPALSSIAEESCYCQNNPTATECVPCEETAEGCPGNGGDPGDIMPSVLEY